MSGAIDNPLHQDDAIARASGFDGVIAHGMFTMGHLATCVVAWAGDAAAITAISAQFRATVSMGQEIVAGGRVRRSTRPKRTATLELWVSSERDGETEWPIKRGEATVRLLRGPGDRLEALRARRVADIAWIASLIRSITTCMSFPTPSSTRTESRSIFSPSTSATLTIDSVVDCVSWCSCSLIVRSFPSTRALHVVGEARLQLLDRAQRLANELGIERFARRDRLAFAHGRCQGLVVRTDQAGDRGHAVVDVGPQAFLDRGLALGEHRVDAIDRADAAVHALDVASTRRRHRGRHVASDLLGDGARAQPSSSSTALGDQPPCASRRSRGSCRPGRSVRSSISLAAPRSRPG